MFLFFLKCLLNFFVIVLFGFFVVVGFVFFLFRWVVFFFGGGGLLSFWGYLFYLMFLIFDYDYYYDY